MFELCSPINCDDLFSLIIAYLFLWKA